MLLQAPPYQTAVKLPAQSTFTTWFVRPERGRRRSSLSLPPPRLMQSAHRKKSLGLLPLGKREDKPWNPPAWLAAVRSTQYTTLLWWQGFACPVSSIANNGNRGLMAWQVLSSRGPEKKVGRVWVAAG